MNPTTVDAPLFRAEQLGMSFNTVSVLESISLEIGRGEVVALLGENGAGKSTLSSIIAGSLCPTRGSMQLDGQAYAPTCPKDAIALGVNMIHQEIQLLPELSVAENIFLGHLPTRHGVLDRERMRREARVQLERLGLDISPDTLVRDLRIAAQQLVEIAKALTLESRLLILDEPTAALGSEETELLFRQIEVLKREGVSFIYISHRMEEIGRIADRVLVMRDGHLVARHERADVAVDTLVAQMVGRSIERLFPAIAAPQSHEVLQVRGLSCRNQRFRDISFSVRGGEVFGIAGMVGAGRSEVIRAIAGVDPVAGGEVRVDGKPLRLDGVRASIAAGVVLVPEDRKGEGVVLDHSIAENLAYCNLDRLGARGLLSRRRIDAFASERIASLGVKGDPGKHLDKLSGGNQQKVVIAKWIAREPRVIILDEPTRGIDMGARAAIYQLIADLAATGAAVVVVSSDLDEVIGLSHRVMVMARGACQGILDGEQVAPESIMALATA
ncbi:MULTISPECIES: sugar ABC transporter ATP-binding protein [unclassified Pseudomonas]|uniref:sugar ABC transporter ATP-binding protein n=1 Tax=unclassified Pseudomonas TaxID=196821 RepID=UPI000BA2C480|nr:MULTISPECIES: sugar ABC transporter ATP-binding protein [unclassified Pseudomonas]MCU1723819.1 sugar ABC transporter ATP-binding protein [Pseudomonas sp. 5P_5.1_Bac1]MCU1734478.1 sugar ABC transporter ATP-binding protein [Pseudomonas sp. 20P_3.2_Bac4]MCU1745545.1 sugar ABC transporter ATP-binding protein [Pseudomonas sp. 20P_3.2_Bac5]